MASLPQVPSTSNARLSSADICIPGSSTELRPQQNTDYVSPMILHYVDAPHDPFRNSMENTTTPLPQQQQQQSQYFNPRGFTSAPANIAFNSNSHSIPLSSDIDFDISPLTSPWLGANQQPMASRHPSNKRNASPSGDESPEKPGRKRQSPAIRPTNPKKAIRGFKSTTSTPLLRTTRSRRGSTNGDMIGDTPSPVDLSMPPPAPPANQGIPSASPSPSLNPHLTPVTPASIMNLGKFGLNRRLAPASDSSVVKPEQKNKPPARPRAVTDAAVRGKSIKKSAAPNPSPNLKAILPGTLFTIHTIYPQTVLI
jgi:hypothetical protein